jgi:phage-related protein
MEIRFYTKANGKMPVLEFIQKLIPDDKAKILVLLDELGKNGLETQRMQFKQFTGVKKLWEIKIKGKGGNYRIFYVHIEKNILMLLHAFQKKTQRTPIAEKEIVIKRLKEVMSNE